MSTAEIALRPAGALQHFDREQVELLKRTICRGATDDELRLFVQTAERLRLDPFARQIFAVKRKSKEGNAWVEVMSSQVSIDGFRLVAERTNRYAGQLGPFWTEDGKEWLEVWLASKPPAAAKVGVLRHDFKEPVWAVATWEQYKQTKYDGGLTSMWAKMGPLMLAKCAESLALRRAFPNELSGVYSDAEMAQAGPTVDVEAEPVDPAYKATVQDSRPGPVTPPPLPAQAGSTSPPKAEAVAATSAASVVSPAATVTTSAPSTTTQAAPIKPVGTGANVIVHDGALATPKQVDTMHALRGKIPTLAASPDHALSAWRKTVGVYRRQDGSRCEHCNEMSKEQASHLIGRMMEKAGKLEASEAEIRSGTTGEVVPAKESANFDNPANWLEYIHGLFPTASEEDAYFADFHAAGGYASAEEVPESSRKMVGLLIASLKMGQSEYKKVWNNARALGHLPGFQP